MHNYKLKLQANYNPGYGYGNEISIQWQLCTGILFFFFNPTGMSGAAVFHLFGRRSKPKRVWGTIAEECAASQPSDEWTRRAKVGANRYCLPDNGQ